MDLQQKNIIYIGGFGGIGYASCKCFLEQRVKFLAVFDVNEDIVKLQELQSLAAAIEAEVFFIKTDITKKSNVEEAFALAHAKMGHFDLVINGSGMMDEQRIEQTLHVNLLGVIYASLSALQYMDKSQGGQGGLIVNISSVVGLDVYGAYAVYTATKHGVTGFTRALANPFYYERTQVAFVTICPGTTETPMLAALRNNRVTTFEERPPLPQSLVPQQSAESCAQRLIEALKIAKNGSVYIISGGALKEFTSIPTEF